jgi:TIR domain
VFFDNGTLEPGMRWLEEIKSGVASSAALLALIGASWKRSLLAHLRPGEVDYVTKEIDLAFRAREHVTVIPVLIDDARMPDQRELPPALKGLCSCHAERLRHSHLQSDIDHLLARLAQLVEAPQELEGATAALVPPGAAPGSGGDG